MTSRFPPEIREEVLVMWLRALSRDEIAISIGIGAGTVSEIVKSYGLPNPGFDLYREFVVTVKKEGSNIHEFASAIRLRRLLENNDLSEEQIESFLRDTAMHCFRKGIDVKGFIGDIDRVSDLVYKTGVAVEGLSEYIHEKKKELNWVSIDLVSRNAEKEVLLQNIKRLQIQLADTRKNLCKVQQEVRSLQWTEPFNKKQLAEAFVYVMNKWLWEKSFGNILARELAEANRKLYGSSKDP